MMLTSGIILSIASGLLSLLDQHTPTARWVGYQILLGVGRGTGIQMPTLAVQSELPLDETPVGLSLILFSQTLTSSVFLTVANTILKDVLVARLSAAAVPGVSPSAVADAGATDLRSSVPGQFLDRVLTAYSAALGSVFYLSAALSVVYFFSSFGVGRCNVKNANNRGSDEGEEKI